MLSRRRGELEIFEFNLLISLMTKNSCIYNYYLAVYLSIATSLSAGSAGLDPAYNARPKLVGWVSHPERSGCVKTWRAEEENRLGETPKHRWPNKRFKILHYVLSKVYPLVEGAGLPAGRS